MMDLDFSFEVSPWEAFIRTKQSGDTVTAMTLLTLLEGGDDQSLEEAFEDLENGCIALSVEDLPKAPGTGEAAVRLRREQELVRQGLTPESLEENDPLRLYLEEVAMTPAFGDEQLLAQSLAAGDEKAAQQLTNLGLRLVIDLACEYTGWGVLLMDLIQEGSLGLWQAIGSYHGGDYGSHCRRAIRFALAKAVTAHAWATGAGQKMRAAVEDYRQVDERLLSELGRNPTLEEIALEMHISPESAYTIRKMMDDARILAGIRKPAEEEAQEEEADQAVENTALFQMRQRVQELLSSLSEQDARLLTMRFGLEGGLPLSPEEAGKRLGLTAGEVIARETAALSKLRNI